ncbi:hypothetical protein J0H58_06790 [bacterium]|nr:hypothetical protein [bacterium]
MDEATTREYIARMCPHATVVDASGGTFFFTDPEQKFPFATLSTNDEYDQSSDLGRPGAYRLNIGVGKEAFRSLFGVAGEAEYDFTAPDQLMPHPVYGKMYWVCVVNPGPATAEAVRTLLADAYAADLQRRRTSVE